MTAEKFFDVSLKIEYGKLIKSGLDRIVAAVTLLFLSPLLLIVTVFVYFHMGSPILFSQYRVGKQGLIFKVFKFRSMTDARDANGNLLSDEERLTVFGKLLRRSKLDETLQLWNILKGEMSFVGPRPTIPEQVQNYNELQKCRLLVLPGLTGWAQVNGNTELTWDERICLDLWYLNHWSLWLDFIIIIRTVGVVIWGEHRNETRLKWATNFTNNSFKVAENNILEA